MYITYEGIRLSSRVAYRGIVHVHDVINISLNILGILSELMVAPVVDISMVELL